VYEAMAPFLTDTFGNPSSTHGFGRAARAALEESRARIATALGARRHEILFTGSGTEADNIAVLGRSRADRAAGGSGAVACSAVEHKAVLGAAHAAHAEGSPLAILAVDEAAFILIDALDEVLAVKPAVVSMMWVNNEVGTVQPIAELGARCRAAGIALHSDAVQALGKLRVRVDETPCDLLALSAHKVGGPKGIGALYVRDGMAVEPLIHGGGQESGLRPGTQNVAAAVGFATAVELAVAELESESARLTQLRDRLEEGLRAALPGIVRNGAAEHRAPHILNVSVPGVDQEVLLVSLDLEGIAASSGSACQSGSIEPSHVLLAMGHADEGQASVRFSLGRTTTAQDIAEAVARIPGIVERVRAGAAA
jgi:cysteine desulfurase